MADDNAIARGRLVLALDFGDLDQARRIARSCAPFFATVKVGLELFVAAGPRAVDELRDDGFAVFVDLKLHDIPETVRRAAAEIAELGAAYATVHAQADPQMLEAAALGFAEGSEARAGAPTIGLGVTALTSENADKEVVVGRAEQAKRAGLGGVVCGVGDLYELRANVPGLLTVVPGIRPKGAAHDDQRRVGTPQTAIRSGADLLVIGRAVTRAEDPGRSAEAIATEVAQATTMEILVDGGASR
ncbi:MAG TPA: orotidine-5'-phosphate decarboxylase [Acidimicrobiales bacterium]|nr:orotidine-5'-phosphate decarboxylase [Acidimicrobiales bacterium]